MSGLTPSANEAALLKIMKADSRRRRGRYNQLAGIDTSLPRKKGRGPAGQRYLITAPDGASFEITNLKKFCAENKLSRNKIKETNSKGYKAVKVRRMISE